MSIVRAPSFALSAARLRVAVRAGLVLAALAVACAVPARLYAENGAILDLRRAMRAQQALEQDPVLAPLKLWVTVRQGVAVLMGPVPTAELAERAAACLRRLPELTGVRNELFLDPWGDTPPAGPAPAGPQPLHRQASRSDEGKPPPPLAPPSWIPSPAQAQTPVIVPGARGALRPAPAPPASALVQAVRRLQGGQERYRRVRVEVQTGRVYLSGAVPAWRDVDELSKRIAELPGVAGVTIREIRTDTPPR